MSSPSEASEDIYGRLLGRQPTDAERERLHRIRDGLGIRSNDALWHVLLVLDTYDTEFRRYPTMLARETDKILANIRTTVGDLARAETALAHSSLAEMLADTTHQVAAAKAARGFPLLLGWVSFALVVLCGTCLTAGYVLASGHAPAWAGPTSSSWLLSLLHCVLGAPVGWLIIITAAIAVPLWRMKAGKPRPRWHEWASIAGLTLAALGTLLTFAA